MSSIRAVFFDLYNTLARFDPPRETVQAAAAGEFGITLTKEGVDAGYHLADGLMAEQTGRAPLSSLSSEEQAQFFARYEQLVLRGAGHDVDLELAGDIWRRVRRQEYRLALFDDVIPSLDELRGSGYVVGVISNIDRNGYELAEDLGLSGHVDFTVTSKEAGVGKPHPAIFSLALERAGQPPDRSAHVGDQVSSDVEGAVAAGIRPVLLDRYGVQSDYTACPRITSMTELPAVLAAM